MARVPADTVLATVGDGRVTAGEVQAALAAMPGADRAPYATPEGLRELVETLVDRRLMAAAARAAGLDRDPVMQSMLGEPPPGTDPDEMLAEVWRAEELAKGTAPAALRERLRKDVAVAVDEAAVRAFLGAGTPPP